MKDLNAESPPSPWPSPPGEANPYAVSSGVRALQWAVVRRSALVFPRCAGWRPTDWGCALAGEVGEACNLIKKQLRGDKIDPVAIGKEIADVMIYAALLAESLNMDLAHFVREKFNEVSREKGCEVRVS